MLKRLRSWPTPVRISAMLTRVRWPLAVCTTQARSVTGSSAKVITMRPSLGWRGSTTVMWVPLPSRVAPSTMPGSRRLRLSRSSRASGVRASG
jgi:hypothetical protein